MSVGLCDGPITRPDSPAECGMSEYDLDTLTTKRYRATWAADPRRKLFNQTHTLVCDCL
jgi:hypothetical protein